MPHALTVNRYPAPLADLAAEVAELRYDALADFLCALAAQLAADAAADRGRGRVRLAGHLHDAAAGVGTGAESIRKAWAICEPHMPADGG